MKVKYLLSISLASLMFASCSSNSVNNNAVSSDDDTPSLYKAYEDCWYTGMSVNQWEVAPQEGSNNHDYTGGFSLDQTKDWDIITKHFNWVVAENCMKCEVIHPEQNRYDFTLADQFVEKAKAAGLKVMGHNLIWHSQCAKWFHYDKDGNLVSADTLKARMKEHITSVLNHFKGKVDAWDVCNECFEDDGSFRNSLFYQILGPEYIELAFKYAQEADPDIELFYNDYSMNKASKIEGVCNYFKPLIENGLKVSAIILQGHIILEDGAQNIINQYDHSIKCVEALGIKTGFSELDLSILPNPFGFSGANVSDKLAYRPEMDPYREGLPKEKQDEVDEFWIDFYKMLLTHKDNIQRVGFWCLNDANSWKNDFPIRGRMDYATLFDRNNKAKSTIKKLVELRKEK